MKLKNLSGLALAAVLAGCATDTPPANPNKDKLMWDYRAALTALRQGQFERARALLDGAMVELDNAADREAREATLRPVHKFFLGEPFERVMARYYRAMIHWMEGRPGDAQRLYRAAQTTDAIASRGAADYVLLDYLDGLLSARRGADGSVSLRRAEARSAVKPLPAYDDKANVIVFAEFGRGPAKTPTGSPGEPVRFTPAKVEATAAEISFGSKTVKLPALDDLYRQAGQPSGDTRSWNNLPQFLGFAALRLPPGHHEGEVRFLDSGGQEIPHLRKVVALNAYPDRDTVVFASDQNQ